jgi:hypothetical protein
MTRNIYAITTGFSLQYLMYREGKFSPLDSSSDIDAFHLLSMTLIGYILLVSLPRMK